MNALERWAIKKFIAKEIDDIAKGKEGPDMQNFLDLVKRNRGKIGAVIVFIAGGMIAYPDPKISHYGALLMPVGAYVAGAGFNKSDQYQRDKQALAKESEPLLYP